MRLCTILVLSLVSTACDADESDVARSVVLEKEVAAVRPPDQTPRVVPEKKTPAAEQPDEAPVVDDAKEVPVLPEGKPKLTYAELSEGARIGFEPMAVKRLPAVTFTEFFGKQRADSLEFAEAFVSRLEKQLGKKVEQVYLFNGGSTRNSLAFVYHPDESVRGIEITADASLLAWLDALASEFDGTTAHRITSSDFSGGPFAKWDGLLADPTPVALKQAPSSYTREAEALEKDRYFAFDAVEPNTEYDTKRFETAYAAFMQARGTEASDANARAIRRLEASLGVPLPGDFTALYMKTGGLEEVFFGHALLSSDAVLGQSERWQEIYSGWSLDDLKSQQSAEPGIHPVYVTPRWIPFIDLVGGNFLAVDLAPVGDAPYGQIITFGADVHGKRRIAGSVTELLEKCASYDGSKEHELYSVFGELRL